MSSKTLTFTACWVNLSDAWTETVFHDGTRVVAVPGNDAAYGAHARDLGYAGENANAQMSQEHEVLHTFLADRLRGGGASPTLWAVAHDQTGMVAPVWEQEIEEALVLSFQRFLNGGDGGHEIAALQHGDVDVDALRRDALQLLRGN